MKLLGLLTLILLAVSCDPYGFGFKKNPAYILSEVYKAVNDLNDERFLQVTGKEALCVYGNSAGLMYLREKFLLNPKKVDIKPSVLSSKYFKSPQFVGYWSYYSERYLVDILDKSNSKSVLQVIFDCDYGTDGEKNEKLINLKPSLYSKKACRLTKIIPKDVEPLPVSEQCENLRVNLKG
jgi:hypothetical protein